MGNPHNPTGSVTMPEPTPVIPDAPVEPVVEPVVVEPPAEPVKDAAYWEAEAAKWKTHSRKHEDSAKSNAEKAKAHDELQESQKTELQKAADRAAAAESKVAEIEARAIRAEVAAAKGVPANLIAGSTKEELEAAADALIAFRGEKPKPDFGGGDRGTDVTAKGVQITSREALKSMSSEEINKARLEGRLDTLLGRKP